MELLFKKPLVRLRVGEYFPCYGATDFVALGFSVASRAGFFNVGLPGQAFAGWIMALGLPCPSQICLAY